jgi:hypothetical protein
MDRAGLSEHGAVFNDNGVGADHPFFRILFGNVFRLGLSQNPHINFRGRQGDGGFIDVAGDDGK